MRITADQRMSIAKMVLQQIPWASIVVGAPRYSFISIDRGYWVRGTRSATRPHGPSSAWSRVPEGALMLHWDCASLEASLMMEIEPGSGMMSRQIECKKITVPTSWPRGEKLQALANWLVCRAVEGIPEWDDEKIASVPLHPGERLQIVQYRPGAPTYHRRTLRAQVLIGGLSSPDEAAGAKP
jgi:hypothetical protein